MTEINDSLIYEWPVLGLNSWPSGVLPRLTQGESRLATASPTITVHSWASVIMPVIKITQTQSDSNLGSDDVRALVTPRLLSRVTFRSFEAMALVSDLDPCKILILQGSQRSLALVISFDFEIQAIATLCNEQRLYVLKRESKKIYEIYLTNSKIEAAENKNFRLSTQYRAHEVNYKDITERRFELVVPNSFHVNQMTLIQTDYPDLRERLVLCSVKMDTLQFAVLPSIEKIERPAFRPSDHSSPTSDRHDFQSDGKSPFGSSYISLHSDTLKTELSEYVLKGMSLSNLVANHHARVVWMIDSANNRLIEIAIPGSKLKSKVVVEESKIQHACGFNGPIQLSNLIAYEDTSGFVHNLNENLKYFNKKGICVPSLTTSARDSIVSSVPSRKIFSFIEMNSSKIVFVYCIKNKKGIWHTDLHAQYVDFGRINGQLQISQNYNDGFLIWSSSSQTFIQIDSNFDFRTEKIKDISNTDKDILNRSFVRKAPKT